MAERIVETLRQPLLVLDERHHVRQANECFYRTFHVSAEETIGHRIYDLGNRQWDIPALHELLEKILPLNSHFDDFEVQHTFEGIGPRTMLLNARRVVHDGETILLAIEDITERKLAQQSRFFLASVIDTSEDAIITVTPEGIITTWNKAAERIYGYPSAEVIGKPLAILSIPEDPYQLEGFFKNLRSGHREQRLEIERVRKDGQRIWLSVQFSGIPDSAGKVVAISTISRDITRRKRTLDALQKAEDQIRRHAGDLEETVAERTRELKETIHSLERFCYSIAHDLRAPLRAMHGFAVALQEDCGEVVGTTGRDYIERIVRASKWMDSLVNDLLAFGQLSHIDLPCEMVSLDEALQRALEQHTADIGTREAAIHVKGPLPTIYSNAFALQHIFMQLIGNALKFQREEVPPEITIGAEDFPDKIHVFVEDNGIGIALEHHERIFSIFERIDQSNPGTGIGLALVMKAIERLGGTLGVESKPGEGSCFWYELPK